VEILKGKDKNKYNMLGVVVNTCKPSTWEVEAGGWSIQGQSGLYGETLSPKNQTRPNKMKQDKKQQQHTHKYKR
jgi:hypothetical protein